MACGEGGDDSGDRGGALAAPGTGDLEAPQRAQAAAWAAGRSTTPPAVNP